MKRRDEVLVGLLTTVAVVLLIVGVIWLSRGGLSKGYPLYAKFAWGPNLKQGQPVLLAGVSVGYVDDAQLLQNEGAVVVTLRLHNEYMVPRGTTAAVVANGLFGDMAIALTPRAPSPVSFNPGDTVPSAKGAPGLSDLTARFDTISQTVQTLTNELRAQFVTNGGLADLRKTAASLDRLGNQLNQVVAAQSRSLSATMASVHSTAESVRGTAELARGTVTRVNAAIDTAEIQTSLRNVRTTTANAAALSDSLSRTLTRVNGLIARLESGDGSAAKLLNDPGLYDDTRRLVQRVDSLLLDFQKNPKKYINLRIF